MHTVLSAVWFSVSSLPCPAITTCDLRSCGKILQLNLNHTFLLGGLSVSSVSSSSSSSLCDLVRRLAAGIWFERVRLGKGGVGGPVAEGPAATLVSMVIRYESMSSFMKSSGGGGVHALRRVEENWVHVNLKKYLFDIFLQLALSHNFFFWELWNFERHVNKR